MGYPFATPFYFAGLQIRWNYQELMVFGKKDWESAQTVNKIFDVSVKGFFLPFPLLPKTRSSRTRFFSSLPNPE